MAHGVFVLVDLVIRPARVILQLVWRHFLVCTATKQLHALRIDLLGRTDHCLCVECCRTTSHVERAGKLGSCAVALRPKVLQSHGLHCHDIVFVRAGDSCCGWHLLISLLKLGLAEAKLRRGLQAASMVGHFQLVKILRTELYLMLEADQVFEEGSFT